MLGELVEQDPQRGFTVGQRRVMQALPIRAKTDCVMGILTDIQTEEHPKTAAHPPCHSSAVSDHRSSIDGRHPRYDQTYPHPSKARRPCPYQRSLDATRPGDTTPWIMHTTGGISHTRPADHSS